MKRSSANSPRKQPKQARSRALVDAILEAAARVFVEDGFEAASTNRIAREAGVSIGSLYQYFPSKDALLSALSERTNEHLTELVLNSLRADAPLHARVQDVLHAMIRFFAAAPELQKILVLEHPRTGIDERVRHAESTAAALIRRLLEQLRAEGKTRVSDLDAAAFVIVYAVQGVTLARALRAPDAASDEALAQELSALVLRYVGLDDTLV